MDSLDLEVALFREANEICKDRRRLMEVALERPPDPVRIAEAMGALGLTMENALTLMAVALQNLRETPR